MGKRMSCAAQTSAGKQAGPAADVFDCNDQEPTNLSSAMTSWKFGLSWGSCAQQRLISE
jgi:hypothetical protein